MRAAVTIMVVGLVACSEPKLIYPDTMFAPVEEDAGGALVTACPKEAVLGCTSPFGRKICNKEGTGFEEVPCTNGQICLGNGECKAAKCVPGTTICETPSKVGRCRSDGQDYEPLETCGMGLACEPKTGACASSCGGSLKAKSNVGCSYGVVDLGNYESVKENNPVDRPLLVVVSNTSGTSDAHITFTAMNDGSTLPFTAPELTVPPLSLKTYTMPTGFAQLYTGINKWSWFVKSDQPITLHMFNPQNGPDVRSNDASLLFPTDALGTDYVIMSWKTFYTDALQFEPNGYPKYGFPNYATILATASGTSHVTVTPTADVRPSPSNIAGLDKAEALKKGQSYTYNLEQGQVLNFAVEPKLSDNIDLTGTIIHSDRPVAVYSAHNCAFVPSIDVKYCDHLEGQLAPVDTWGTKYVADLFAKRAEKDYNVWRVMASKDQTVVTTNPKIQGVSGKILGKYQWIEYQANIAHTIEATAPVQVGHFMIGSNFPDFKPVCGDALTGIGDPSFTPGVALKQYVNNYVILTPPGYEEDYINIVRPKGVEVRLDQKPIKEGEAGANGYKTQRFDVGTSGFEVFQIPVNDGVHRVDSSELVGVTGYGYDCDVSYAYPGGMILDPEAAGSQ